MDTFKNLTVNAVGQNPGESCLAVGFDITYIDENNEEKNTPAAIRDADGDLKTQEDQFMHVFARGSRFPFSRWHLQNSETTKLFSSQPALLKGVNKFFAKGEVIPLPEGYECSL